MRNSTFFALLMIFLTPAAASASDPVAQASDKHAVTLERVVVVASRVTEPLSQVVGSVSVIEREQMDIHRVQDIADLMRYEPGVVVTSDATRFGLQGYSIRGLEGNRVRIEFDGVPLPDAFAIGNFSAAGRDLVDTEVLQRVEVLRGPASTLYGSDALAGIVAYRSRDPQDFLDRVDGDHYLGAHADYASRDQSHLLGAIWAGRAGAWQAMVSMARRSGKQTQNNARDAIHDANPQDYDRSSLLAKLLWDGRRAGDWTLTLDQGRSEADTNLRSMVHGPGQFATTTRMQSNDKDRRRRISLTQQWKPGWSVLDSLETLVYTQLTRTRQHADQWRERDTRTPYPTLRERDFAFDQRGDGLRLVGQTRAQTGPLSHWQVFGIEYGRIRYEGLRDGLETNLDTGDSTSVIIGERMPVRDFPNSTSSQIAGFWQDEIAWGRFAIVPGVRWERYRLSAYPDTIYREDNPAVTPADIASISLTPKLGARMSIGDSGSVYVQYARGYRAPPFSDVNVAFTIPAFNYMTLPNPNLRPETSHGVEAGYRYEGATRSFELSVYENRYRDLIESRARIGTDPATGALLFQSVNRDHARIRGVEMSLSQSLGHALRGDWSLRSAVAWAYGDDTARDLPLNTVQPARAVVSVRYQAMDWGVELTGTAAERVKRVDDSAGALFRSPGYGVLDLFVWYEPAQHLRLHAGVFNLGNRRYWEWRAARNIALDARDRDFFTAPGIHASIGVNVFW